LKQNFKTSISFPRNHLEDQPQQAMPTPTSGNAHQAIENRSVNHDAKKLSQTRFVFAAAPSPEYAQRCKAQTL
jgi:hypothetical protein